MQILVYVGPTCLLDPVTGALYSFFQNVDILYSFFQIFDILWVWENVKISKKGVQRPSYWVYLFTSTTISIFNL